MPRYSLTVQSFPYVEGGPPTYGMLVDFDGDMNDSANFYRLLKKAAEQAGSVIVGVDDEGNHIYRSEVVN